MINAENSELRFGYAVSLYEEVSGVTMSQLDALALFFPGLIVRERTDSEKTDAEFNEHDCVIEASAVNGKLYTGNDGKVRQLTGRLYGTAKGNREKERKNAELIHRRMTRDLCSDEQRTVQLKEHIQMLLSRLNDVQRERFEDVLLEYIVFLAAGRAEMSAYEKDAEAFPMDDEVFDGVVWNAAYQLARWNEEGTAAAYLWLLLGSLLRNEAGRLVRLYDSSFLQVYGQRGEETDLLSRLEYLFSPQEFEYTYDGDDLGRRFPGIEWFCDRCGDHLNEQEGFDDHLPVWKCTRCGYPNKLDYSAVFDSREQLRDGEPADKQKMEEALRKRRQKD